MKSNTFINLLHMVARMQLHLQSGVCVCVSHSLVHIRRFTFSTYLLIYTVAVSASTQYDYISINLFVDNKHLQLPSLDNSDLKRNFIGSSAICSCLASEMKLCKLEVQCKNAT